MTQKNKFFSIITIFNSYSTKTTFYLLILNLKFLNSLISDKSTVKSKKTAWFLTVMLLAIYCNHFYRVQWLQNTKQQNIIIIIIRLMWSQRPSRCFYCCKISHWWLCQIFKETLNLNFFWVFLKPRNTPKSKCIVV